MQVKANQFLSQLNLQTPPQVMMLFGDEPQQQIEIIDGIRAHVKNIGYEERQNFTLDADFEWAQVIDALQSMSLFCDKQYIELHMPSLKPGTSGAKYLSQIAQMDHPDAILLIHGPKAGRDVQNTKWFKSFLGKAWVCHIYELEGSALNTWLRNKAQSTQLNIADDGISIIAAYSEGNMLAAKQTLDKLALQFTANQVIDAKILSPILEQQSRYSVFEFTDQVLLGNSSKAIQILGRLEDEGLEPVVILWSLIREAQILFQLLENKHNGQPINFKSLRIWPNKQAIYQKAMSNLNFTSMQSLSKALAQAEIKFKSQTVAKPYVFIAHLALLFIMPQQLEKLQIA